MSAFTVPEASAPALLPGSCEACAQDIFRPQQSLDGSSISCRKGRCPGECEEGPRNERTLVLRPGGRLLTS